MPSIFRAIKAALSYEDQQGRFPGRRGILATIGPRRRYKTGGKYADKRVNRSQECARRRRQIEKGTLRLT